jgi:hypothetical protein
VNPPHPWADLAETHSAVVVFFGEHAYKVKKPVRFDFLDFSTREARERAAHREVELNRRLAPDVYLGVADVVGADGEVCDHLVVMRRMPADRRLSTLVLSGAPLEAEVRAIARTIALFHADAPTDESIAVVGSPDRIEEKLARDFADLRGFAGRVFPVEALDEAEALARRYLRGRSALLEARVAEGWIRDGHGDLLADDIFCLPDGPRILDCLDFSDELRHGDVLADLAFLMMDLERLGAPALAAHLVASYHEYSGEHHPASLVDFYIAFRALVRAKVAAIRVDQGDASASRLANDLLALAISHLRRSRVALVLVGGAPGTGKSTLAKRLSADRGWPVLRTDVVRKELMGLRPENHAPAALAAGIYTEAVTERTYEEILVRARRALELGETVVLDASWCRADRRAEAGEVAAATASDLVELRCDLPPEVADSRLAQRAADGRDASDADSEIAAALRRAEEPWPTAVTLDTRASPREVAEQALAAIDRTVA